MFFSSAAAPISGLYPILNHISSELTNTWDQFLIHSLGYDLIAPAWLRHRVQGTPDLRTYVEAGRLSRMSTESALHTLPKRLRDFPRILDFGCGCGRTLRWMRDLTPSSRLYGADIDAEAIDWCRKHFGFVSFQKTNFQPPLPYADDSFDFIYALSVFTHLPPEAQFAWLSELRRVLAPGGILLLTFLGYRPEKLQSRTGDSVPRLFGRRVLISTDMNMWAFLEPSDIRRLETEGVAFVPYGDSSPENEYGISYCRQEFVVEKFSPFLAVREYLQDAFGSLDVALLEKEPPRGLAETSAAASPSISPPAKSVSR
jgi:SAM-dependent methyltransferase